MIINKKLFIGIVGTGFIAKEIEKQLHQYEVNCEILFIERNAQKSEFEVLDLVFLCIPENETSKVFGEIPIRNYDGNDIVVIDVSGYQVEKAIENKVSYHSYGNLYGNLSKLTATISVPCIWANIINVLMIPIVDSVIIKNLTHKIIKPKVFVVAGNSIFGKNKVIDTNCCYQYEIPSNFYYEINSYLNSLIREELPNMSIRIKPVTYIGSHERGIQASYVVPTTIINGMSIKELYKYQYSDFPDIIVRDQLASTSEVENTRKIIISVTELGDNTTSVTVTLDNVYRTAYNAIFCAMRVLHYPVFYDPKKEIPNSEIEN